MKLVRDTRSWVDKPPPQQQGGLFGMKGYSGPEENVQQPTDMGEPPRPGPGSLVEQTQMTSIFYYCVWRARGKSHEA
jgi:hypothetical protein